jgi:hypothetical protein
MAAKKPSSKRIVLRTGEALVEGDLDYLCAEPEIVIGKWMALWVSLSQIS